MKVYVRRAYERIVRDYPVYLNDALASAITESIHKWYDQKDLVVTVQMLEEVVDDSLDENEVEWEVELTNAEKGYRNSLYGYIHDWISDAAWESDEPLEVDGEANDWDYYVTTADEFRGITY